MRETVTTGKVRLILPLGALMVLFSALACSSSEPAAMPTTSVADVQETAQTESYEVKLVVGPLVNWLTMTMID